MSDIIGLTQGLKSPTNRSEIGKLNKVIFDLQMAISTLRAATLSAGAPTDATYVTLSTNGTLTNERVLTAGTGIGIVDGGAGSTVTISATGGSPGGSDKHVQFNNSSAFGGSSNFQFDDTKNLVTIASTFDALGASLTSTYPLLYCLLDGTVSQLPSYNYSYVAIFQNSGTNDDALISIFSASNGICGVSFGDSTGIEYGGVYYNHANDAWNFKSSNSNRTLTLDYTGNWTVGIKDGGFGDVDGYDLLIKSGDGGSGGSGNHDGGDLTLSVGEKQGSGNAGIFYVKKQSDTWLKIENGHIYVTDEKNIVFSATTGTKIGTATTQKIGFWNATPVVRPSAYTPTNVTTDRSYDANATTLDELSDVVGTLIQDLQSIGLIG